LDAKTAEAHRNKYEYKEEKWFSDRAWPNPREGEESIAEFEEQFRG